MNAATNLFDAYKKAESLIAEGNLRAAADLCKEMLDANPEYPYGYHLMASLFSATGTFERAVTFSQKATQLAPEVCAFHMQHGQLLYSLGEYEAAAVSFMAAFHIEPQNPIIILLLASTFTGRGQYEEAHGLFLHARAISDIPEIDEQEGLCHVLQGNQQEAEALFDRIITRCPDYIWGHIYKGQILMNARHFPQAEACMARALKCNPDSFEALFALAVLNDWQGQSEIAIRYAMDAIKTKPLGWECHMFLGSLLLRERHYAEAHQVLAQALTIRPHDPYVLQLLFLALRMTRREPDFLNYIRKQLARHPGNPVLLHFQSMAESELPDHAPNSYVQGYYDGYCEQYDHYQHNVLSYRSPQTIATTLTEWLEENKGNFHNLLDIGCGTGLIASALKELVPYSIGVDISPRMLAKARGKQLYNTLHLSDMLSFMLASEQTFDLVVASDVLCHSGNLSSFCKAARNVLSAKSLLAFTIEKDFHAETWRLCANGRYTHAPHYVRQMLAGEGYKILSHHEHTLHIDNNLAATGVLFIAQKTQTH